MRLAVSIVTFDPNVGEDRATRLIEMHDRLAGPGVPRVLDVVSDPGGSPAVVLEFCGDTVASILARGAEVSAGEVVTIVAPVLSAVLSMHDLGYAHGAVSVAAIALGTAGRPLLLGCEKATPLPDQGSGREHEAAGEDVRRVADVLAELAAAVRDEAGRERVMAASAAIRAGAITPFSSAFRAAAEVRLFEIAEAAPVALAMSSSDTALDEGSRVLTTRRPRRDRVRPATPGGLVPLVSGAARSARRRIESCRDHVIRRSPGGRRGPLILGGTIVVGTIVVLLLMPTGAPEPSGADADDSAHATIDGNTGTPSGGESVGARPAAGVTDDAKDGSSEDVVAGARVAIDALAACASTSTDACWATAIEPGTDLLDEVTVSEDPMSLLPEALALPPDAVDISAREAYGDARVVMVHPTGETTPASVLMIRTEAGWRIREAFDD